MHHFKVGLEVLLQRHLDLLRGKRIGVVSHPAAVTSGLVGIVPALQAAGLHLSALFGAEHGFISAAADGITVKDARDLRSGLPVFSLYGERQEPSPEMLEYVDVLVFDMQDVGVRFYTYLSTLFHLIRFCGSSGCPLVVLDRPNPITGIRVSGPLLEKGWESFVGILPVPVIHGMTLGELARLINTEFAFDADLTVIPMQGWHRKLWFDQITGCESSARIWVPTSPAMPRLETAIVYPGMCFLEGTDLSEGRGTALPFELAGAPWLDGYALADYLNGLHLPGVIFRPAFFTPWASKYRGQVCQGVQLHVIHREAYQSLRVGLELISACQKLASGTLGAFKANHVSTFSFLPPLKAGLHCHFDLLAGSDSLRKDILAGRSVPEIIANWESGLSAFMQLRQKYLLYE